MSNARNLAELLNSDGDVGLADNEKAVFGSASDLEVYANGGYSYIDETGANELNIRTNGANIGLYDTTNSQYLAKFNTAGSSVLYHNGSSKFSTQSDGVLAQGIEYHYPTSGSGRVERVVIPRFTPNYGGSGTPGDWEDFYTPSIGESGRILVVNVNSGGGEYRYISELNYSRASYGGNITLNFTEYMGTSMLDFRVTGTDSTSKIQIRNSYGYGNNTMAEITRIRA
jgi:hypothetical protein